MSKSRSSEAILEGMLADVGDCAVLCYTILCCIGTREPKRETAEKSGKGRGYTQREVRESSR
jgi:hypothetical protein